MRSGALIHHVDNSTGTYTHLVDFTPETGNNFSDAAKAAGAGTYVDPYTNLSFSVASIVGTAPASTLNVTVNYGPVPCVAGNPTVSISPASQSGQPTANLNYSVSVTNNDTTGCTASTFNLTSVLPSGWNGSFINASPSITPGTTSSTTLQVTIPVSAAPSSNSISATAARGTNNGTGYATEIGRAHV